MAFLHEYRAEVETLRPAVLIAALKAGVAQQDAEDAAQNVLVRALTDHPDKRIPYDPATHRDGILNILLSILSFEVRRRRQPGREIPNGHLEDYWYPMLEDRQEALSESARGEWRLLLLGAKLNPKQSRCLYAWLDGYTHQEIADELGVTREDVTYHIGEARKRVMRFWDKGGETITPALFAWLSRVTIKGGQVSSAKALAARKLWLNPRATW